MPALVVAEHRVPVFNERADDVHVPAAMLSDTMDEHDGGTRLSILAASTGDGVRGRLRPRTVPLCKPC